MYIVFQLPLKNCYRRADDWQENNTAAYRFLRDLRAGAPTDRLICGRSVPAKDTLMWMKIGSNDITAQVPGVS
jgi:hypothetical protein